MREKELILYLNEIINVKFLSPKKEKEILIRAKKGDVKAKNILIKAHLPLVINLAKRYLNHGLPLSDLVQEGNIALITAIDKFNLKWNNRFSTYATYCIRQHILRSIYNKSRIIRLPVYIYEKVMKLKKLEKNYKNKYGKLPTIKELARLAKTTPENIKKLYSYFESIASLDEFKMNVPTNNMSPEKIVIENIYNKKLYKIVQNALNTLEKREKLIISAYFGLKNKQPTSLKDISKNYNLTKERIRQIKNRALKKLANYTPLKQYLMVS